MVVRSELTIEEALADPIVQAAADHVDRKELEEMLPLRGRTAIAPAWTA